MTHNNLDPDYLMRIALRVSQKTTLEERTITKTKIIKQKAPEKVLQNPITVPDPNKIIINKSPIPNGYIFVPSLNLYVAKERTLQNNSWYDCHKKLQAKDERMQTIPEFIEFIKYLKANPNGVVYASASEVASILDDIFAVRAPYRAEWLDADFKVCNSLLHINYNHKVEGHWTVPRNSEELIGCLMEDKTPGISLDEWLDNYNKHGLPMLNVSSGSLYYSYPKDDNNSVANFFVDSIRAGFSCDNSPTRYSGIGVRAVRSVAP